MPEKTVVCIHGLGASKASFSALTQTALVQKHHLVAVDLPGFGDHCAADVPDNPITNAAEILAQEIEKRGWQNVVLVGHSLGGAVALLTASRVRGRVRGVASVEGNLVAEDCGTSRRLATAGSAADCESIKSRAIHEAERSENAGVRDWARDLSKVSCDTLSKYSKQLVELSDSGELLRQFHADTYRKIYLYGDEYVSHPVLRRLDSIKVEYIPGAGHTNFMGDAPQACALAISKLL